MVAKSLGLAALSLIAATSVAAAAHHGKHRTRVVIHPRAVATYPASIKGADAYPAHIVPLAAYPNPGGIGITFEPFGWDRWRRGY